MVFLSLGVWVKADLSSLNLTGGEGMAFNPLRIARIIVDREVVDVPVVSGQSLGHGYQACLVDVAKRMQLPLCNLCKREEFVKGASTEDGLNRWNIIKNVDNITINDKLNFEIETLKGCIVEDVGGFMATLKGGEGGVSVRRTSLFQVSYAIPPYSLAKMVSETIESQLYARQSPALSGTEEEKKKTSGDRRGQAKAQMIWEEEVASPVFAFIFNLDIDYIGKPLITDSSFVVSDREKRIKACILALEQLLDGPFFGAKRSRTYPFVSVEKAIMVLTDKCRVTVASPLYDNFYDKTVNKVCDAINFVRNVIEDVSLLIIGLGKVPNGVEEAGTIGEMFRKCWEWIEQHL